MTELNTTIEWEAHDDGEDGAYQSTCGRFEVTTDPVYHYLRLHHAEDPCESIAEACTLAEIGRVAQNVLALQSA